MSLRIAQEKKGLFFRVAQARKPHCQTEAWHTIENESIKEKDIMTENAKKRFKPSKN